MGMRALVAVSALAIGGAALLARPPESPAAIAPASCIAAAPCPPISPLVVETPRVETAGVQVSPARPNAAPKAAGPYGPEAVLAALDRELELTAGQRAQVEKILHGRQEEIERYHAQIRASGLFRPREWESRVADLLTGSYVRIGALLDSRQNFRFGEMVAARRLADPVEFEPEPHMVVLE